MQTARFKTNIKCMGCVAAVTPHLNKAEGVHSWQVDITDADKVLTVELESEEAKAAVQQALEDAGYKGEVLSQAG